jgi:hypothetical protein
MLVSRVRGKRAGHRAGLVVSAGRERSNRPSVHRRHDGLAREQQRSLCRLLDDFELDL